MKQEINKKEDRAKIHYFSYMQGYFFPIYVRIKPLRLGRICESRKCIVFLLNNHILLFFECSGLRLRVIDSSSYSILILLKRKGDFTLLLNYR